ncbi:cytochrome P450 [Streptomyces sp. NPDC059919]|uniref:cytochrome P450 n=1 Tax=Streptomyces sp. NPDC059919 TaxID=3347004 RepID=UPI003653E967
MWAANPRPPAGAYIPFGEGARRCIGDEFGTIQAALTLAALARRWTLTHLAPAYVQPTTGLVLQPQRLRMRATVRQHKPKTGPVDPSPCRCARSPAGWGSGRRCRAGAGGSGWCGCRRPCRGSPAG